jgi:putative tryptophan/tyrosine transport system substrate-binding protein
MRRREFITLIGGATAAWPLAARAQERPNVPRVGYLFSLAQAESRHLWEACRQGLRELGYVEGQNVFLEARWAEGKYDRLPALVAELELKVDVLIAAATPTNIAAKAGTGTMPVVFVAVADPVRAGLIASLARPGGRFTGLSLLTPETSGKRLQLLTEAVPNVRRVTVLLNPGNLANFVLVEETQAAARPLGIELQLLEVRNPSDVERAFVTASAGHVQAMVVFDDPFIHSHRARIIELAVRHRLPAICGTREYADEGLLMAYGPHRPDLYRRSAVFLDKILKGAKPADIPVEQPTRFELIVNLKTAKALGLELPTALIYLADQVIE